MKRKRQTVDFPKKKTKLGKGKRPPENATRVSFKSQNISIPTQLGQTSIGPITHRKLSLQDLLKQLSHPKPSVCHDALNGLRELFLNSTPLLLNNLSRLVIQLVPALFKQDETVHHALFLLFKHICQMAPPQIMSPYFERMLAGLTCAITHLSPSVRISGLKIMGVLLTHYPQLLQSHLNQLLPYYLPLIGSSSAKHNLTATTGRKMSCQASRLLILKQILYFMTLLSTSLTESTSKSNSPIVNVLEEKVCVSTDCTGTIDLHQYLTSSSLLLKLSSNSVQSSTPIKVNETCPAGFEDQLLQALLEYWIELAPSVTIPPSAGRAKQKAVNELFELVDVLMQLICMLLEVKGHLLGNKRHRIVTYFLPHFPLPSVYGAINIQLAYLLILTEHNSLDPVFQYLSNNISQVTQCVKIITKILNSLRSCNCHSSESIKLFYDAAVKLFIGARMTSSAKQHMLLFIEQLLHRQVKFDDKQSVTFKGFFLCPCLCSLPNLLVKQVQPVNPAVLYCILEILKCSLSLKIESVEQSVITNFHNIYSPEGFITSVPHSLLSPTIHLLGHLSNFTSTDLSLLLSLVRSDKLPLTNVTSLIYLIHNRILLLMSDTCQTVSTTLLSRHISFLLSSLFRYPESKLRQLSTDNQRKQPSLIQPLKACLPKEREDMTEIIVGCLLSGPLPEKQLLHTLEPSLTQLMRSVSVYPVDTVYGLLQLFSQCSAYLSPSLSEEIAPLLLACLVAMETSAPMHELMRPCFLLVQQILTDQSIMKTSVQKLMKENSLNILIP